ncbi:Luc7-like protein 3 [Orchesella cincta]|uniref:Luc7-like protein 3 n=1 Tax=Orchesella cincta TaxID=48709 RepID=A0A1D2N959_ORCCI|nr:Luc7-like protein 3 [Orchesella cincta]
MAKNFMSNILDELMGRDRDALPTDKPRTPKWDDADICTHYLVCFCPHELFVNTKADLGPCAKLHDEQLRKKYQEEANSHRKSVYEAEFIRFAEKMISDIEAKIKRGKMRIALANGPDGGTYAGPGSKNAEKIALLTERINALLSEAEEAGCEGDVEKAQGLMKLCDQLKEEREQLKSNEVSHPWNPDKAMQVCEVCGSYLIIGEAQHRLDDHIMGKQHVGFAMLRKTMDDIRKAKEIRDKEEREKMEREREKRRTGRDMERERDRVVRVDRDRSRKDSDRGDRKRKSRSRSKDRDVRRRSRDRKRSPDREKDRKKRSRSRDIKKDKDHKSADKDKDLDRKRDSSKDHKSSKHSDDKKRSKRSRSRSRDKDKHKRKRSRSRSKDRKDKDRRKRDKDRGEKSDEHRDKKEEKPRKHSLSSHEGSPVPPPPPPEGIDRQNDAESMPMPSPPSSWEGTNNGDSREHRHHQQEDPVSA